MEENTKNNLKIQGLREALRTRVAEITDTYEMRILELRLETTEYAQALQEAQQQIQVLQNQVDQLNQEKDVSPEEASGDSPEDSDLPDQLS